MEYSEIIIPDLGLYSHFPKETVPRFVDKNGMLHIGLSRCRNISLARKTNAIKKSKGVKVFTSSATGPNDSVRGIGILNKYARPQNFESGKTYIEQIDGSGDDVQAKGDAAFSIDGTTLKAGNAPEDIAETEYVQASSDDCYVTDESSIDLTSLIMRFGGIYDMGMRFQTIVVNQGSTISSAYLYLGLTGKVGTPAGALYGEDVDDAATFSTVGNFTGRTKTTANVDINSYTVIQNYGMYLLIRYDVTTIIQEIVNRGGWASLNDLAFLGIGTGSSASDYLNFMTYDYQPHIAHLVINGGSNVVHHIGLLLDGFSGLAQGDHVESARIKIKAENLVGSPSLRIYGHDVDTAFRDTGTHTGGTHATILTDSTASWVVDALIGLTVKNVTDGSTGEITDNDATTVTVAALSGGTDNQWELNDKYEIYNMTVRTVWNGCQDHLTTAYVDWEPEDLVMDEWAYSPDIKDIIQEIVNRSGWDETTIGIFIKDNSSGNESYLEIRSYDYTGNEDGPYLEVDEFIGAPSTPEYFMFVKGASEGEIHKLDSNKAPSEVSQVVETYASSYQSQFGRFLQFGQDMLFSDDGKSDVQIWDISTNPSAFIDAQTNAKARYLFEFKSRLWHLFCMAGGTLYKQRAYYSAVNDPTSVSSYLALFGSDAPTFGIRLNQDEAIVFKEGSSHRLVYRGTGLSDFQAYEISSRDGLLSGNAVSDGARIYGLNEKGVFQWPVAGYPNGFRYISNPIRDEIDKITLDKMILVWFAYDPVNNLVFMHYPDTGYSKNSLCAVFNVGRDCWENISDIWYGNVMEDAFNINGSPIMLFGQEDGHLKYIDGDDNEDADFPGEFEPGALWYKEKNKSYSRTLLNIQPVSNYEGSYTINFYWKGYDRPGDEPTATWYGPYTHQTLKGNEEHVPTKLQDQESRFHIIRVEGPLKDEPFEITGLKLDWLLGSAI